MSTLKSLIKSLKLMERRLPLYLLAIFMMTALNALFEVAGSVFMKIIFIHSWHLIRFSQQDSNKLNPMC